MTDMCDKIEGQSISYAVFDLCSFRRIRSFLFFSFCFFSMIFSIFVLFFMLYEIFKMGFSGFHWNFLFHGPSRFADQAGVYPALTGSLTLFFLTAFLAIPIGVGAGVYIEEIMPNSKFKRILEINVANLSSVPSILYGILGLSFFVRFLGENLLCGALTLTLLSLPTITMTTMEALRQVPWTLRLGAMAMGATKWQTTRDHTLPQAFPQIVTGVILSLSRSMGETAPLLMVGAVTYIGFSPYGLFELFTALPLQIYYWSFRPEPEFQALAARGILVLLSLILGFNSLAIWIRHKFQGKNLCNKM